MAPDRKYSAGEGVWIAFLACLPLWVLVAWLVLR